MYSWLREIYFRLVPIKCKLSNSNLFQGYINWKISIWERAISADVMLGKKLYTGSNRRNYWRKGRKRKDVWKVEVELTKYKMDKNKAKKCARIKYWRIIGWEKLSLRKEKGIYGFRTDIQS
jgi:hypothetical protein